jgi:catechol 2,3-dioxygenase-like lactoylglutathione lyase family enzyme
MSASGTHWVRGVDHTAFVTFEPAETVRFYRDILGFPLSQSICATGWGPAPDFVHFFFDIGNGDQLAFFYYFGHERYEEIEIPELLKSARHLALNVETLEHLDEYERRLTEGGYAPYMRVMHETIESIYVTDPNGLNFEITRPLREATDADRADAQLTIEALLEVLAENDEPSLAGLWAAKGRRIAALAETEDVVS